MPKRRAAALLIALVLWMGAQPAAAANDKATAESLFRAAWALLDQGLVDEACPKFEASLSADPSVGAQLALARCHGLQGKTATAWAEYQQAATMARVARQPDREAAARKRAAELERKLSKLTIRLELPTSATGLRVLRNKNEVDARTLGVATAVDPGSYRVEAQAPGRETWSTEITIGQDGDHKVVIIPSLKQHAKSASASSSKGDGDTANPLPHYLSAAAVGGLGVAAIALGTAFGLQAGNSWDEAQANCRDEADGKHCNSAGAALANEASRSSTISTAGFVVGGAGIVGAVVLLLTAPSAQNTTEPSSAAPAAAKRLRVIPAMTGSAGLVMLQGSF